MKITLEIPDGVCCLCISGVREKDGEIRLVTSMVGRDNTYDGAELKVLWEKDEKERSAQW